jgi:hypothetical protein
LAECRKQSIFVTFCHEGSCGEYEQEMPKVRQGPAQNMG